MRCAEWATPGPQTQSLVAIGGQLRSAVKAVAQRKAVVRSLEAPQPVLAFLNGCSCLPNHLHYNDRGIWRVPVIGGPETLVTELAWAILLSLAGDGLYYRIWQIGSRKYSISASHSSAED
jgi:hypothetical protein